MKKTYLLFTFVLLILATILNPLNISAILDEELTENMEEVEYDSEGSSVRSIPGGEEIEGEEWYYIEVDENGIPKDYQNIDYSETYGMLEFLKPGDIIYETNGSFIGDITGHIGIVYDIVYDKVNNQRYVIMIEVLEDGVGYGLMTPNRLEEKDVIIYRLTNASESQIQGALVFMKSHLGDAFRFPYKKYAEGYKSTDENGNETTSWYCAELVWAAFYSENINLDSNDNSNGDSLIAPAGLASYEYLTTILHYTDDDDEDKYDTTLISNGETGHTYTCDGDTYTEAHDYEEYNYCYEKCRACGYARQVKTHDYTHSYVSQNSTHHHATCECGASINETHSFYVDGEYKMCEDCNYQIEADHVHLYMYRPVISGKTHKRSCSCGDSAIEACFGAAIIGEAAYCAKCGQEINTSSGLLSLDNEPALLPSDDEDYLE